MGEGSVVDLLVVLNLSREEEEEKMANGGGEAEGVAKHVLLAKFKDDVPEAKVEELIKGYANLVSLVPSMKTFHWGRDVSVENLHQGFTHVFVSSFDSVEGIAEYVAHPVHVEFANIFLSFLDKVLIVDFTPTPVA